jgi:hypothetical protein
MKIRSRRKKPLSPRRQRELAALAERDVMTVRQFESWRTDTLQRREAFLQTPHHLSCRHCGRNTEATIVDACELGWLVDSRDERTKLAREVTEFAQKRTN